MTNHTISNQNETAYPSSCISHQLFDFLKNSVMMTIERPANLML